MTWVKSKPAHEQLELLEGHIGHELAVVHEGAIEPGVLLRVALNEVPGGTVLEAFLDLGERFPVKVSGDRVVSCFCQFRMAE